jgi:hypothetical protein
MTRLQPTLAGTGFAKYTKVTRRAQFLAEMDRVVPWRDLGARIDPVYPKAGNGRPPVGLERMLRMYFLQHWCNLSDPAVEEALYDSPTMRAFVGIDLGREPVPDETTVCQFRHLLEPHGLGRGLFDAVTEHLRAQGVTVSTGTIVDATIIAAPSSTKNATGPRDPGRHQTQKGPPVVLRHERALRRRQPEQAHSRRRRHVGQHPRQSGPAVAVARRRPAGVGRFGLRGASRCPQRVCSARPRLHAAARHDAGAAGDHSGEVPGPRPGRASDRCDQTGLRLHEGVLPRLGQEPASPRSGGPALANLFMLRKRLLRLQEA